MNRTKPARRRWNSDDTLFALTDFAAIVVIGIVVLGGLYVGMAYQSGRLHIETDAGVHLLPSFAKIALRAH